MLQVADAESQTSGMQQRLQCQGPQPHGQTQDGDVQEELPCMQDAATGG